MASIRWAQERARNAMRLIAGVTLAILAATATLVTGPASAAVTTGSLFATGVTSPAGLIWLGGDLWVSDANQGFCRVERGIIRPDSCNKAAHTPGQASFDPVTNYVYVPDSANTSLGVWRLKFDPLTKSVGGAELLAPGKGLGGNRAAATALGSDGTLYVSFLKSPDIKRVPSASSAVSTQTVQAFGKSRDGRGVRSLAFAGPNLYLAERAAVTSIGPAGGTALPTPIVVKAPTALTNDGADVLYVADTDSLTRQSTIIRYTISTGAQVLYAAGGVLPDGQSVSFLNATALTVASHTLFVGDDPSGGATMAQGRVWSMPAL